MSQCAKSLSLHKLRLPCLSRVGQLNTRHNTSTLPTHPFLQPISPLPFLEPPSLSLSFPLAPYTPPPLTHSSHFSMPSTCTGSPKDHTACACTLSIPKRSKQTKCKICRHRFSYHSDVPTAPQDFGAPPAPKAPGDKYDTWLFKSREATAVHESAREEMLQGF